MRLHRRVARNINRKANLGALPSVFEGGAFDFTFFQLVVYKPQPFNPSFQPSNPQFHLFTANHLTI
jgi:hypothetical protein